MCIAIYSVRVSTISMSDHPPPVLAPDQNANISAAVRELTDSLSSLHQRMDRFYAWASQLQVEHRDLKQRVGFVEGVAFGAGEVGLGGDS